MFKILSGFQLMWNLHYRVLGCWGVLGHSWVVLSSLCIGARQRGASNVPCHYEMALNTISVATNPKSLSKWWKQTPKSSNGVKIDVAWKHCVSIIQNARKIKCKYYDKVLKRRTID